MERSQKIIRTSVIGILVNLLLIVIKLTLGFMSNSIAVILDGINNMGDALSSIITIIGTKLAGRAPDKKHPYGYGRIEYLTSVLIAVIVSMAGISSVKESAEKIANPEAANYSVVMLAVLGVSVAIKFFCGRYIKSVGEEIHAQSLIASGSDSYFDSLLTLSTLVAAIISMVWGVSLEGFLGLVIAAIIIKAGVEMLLETLNSIIGVRADRELTDAIKEKVGAFDGVRGVYDLALHNYGPTEIIGSVHIEVEDSMPARDIHRLTRQIMVEIYREFGIVLTVGIYASNTSDEKLMEIRGFLEEILKKYPTVLQMHGFYAESEAKVISFDLIVDFEADKEEVQAQILGELAGRYPDYHFYIIIDSDYSD